MRVVMLSWEYPPRVVGGIARHVQDLSRALAARGTEVYVVAYGEPNDSEYENDHGVHVVRAKHGGPGSQDFLTWALQMNFALAAKAVELITSFGERGVDIVHAHDWVTAYAGWVVKHGFKVPLVSTIHATEWGRNGGLHTDLQRRISDVEWWLTYESWKVIVCSAHMEWEVKTVFQVPQDKIAVLPNGVDPLAFAGTDEKAADEVRARYGLGRDKVIFFVGRLVHEKGAHLLVQAMPKILRYYHDAKAVIAGKGPEEGYLRNLVGALGLEGRVVLTGFIDDQTRNALYKAAACAVVPSIYEPFGITALEAMAAGTPVIVADTGGLGETVKHSINGWKFYTGNVNSLADSVLHLLHRPDVARILAKTAYHDVLTTYSWKTIAQGTRDLYRAVVEERRRSDWQTPRDLRIPEVHYAAQTGGGGFEGRYHGGRQRHEASPAHV